ncbi:MAG TPA: hypothetical protein VMM12_05240 [Longimicrobiales bacterium]|nr:hypothetical protein [Longimicrobiales bacterium]
MRGSSLPAGAPLASILALLAACAGEPSPPEVVIRDSAGIRIVENSDPLWEEGEAWVVSGPELILGQGSTPEHQLFRVRDATRLPDGSIAVVNAGTAEVRIYDSRGWPVRTLGRKGRGPGEFPREPSWIEVVPPDTILVADRAGIRTVRFGLDGRHLETELTPGLFYAALAPEGRLPDGRWLEFVDVREESPGEEGLVRATALALVGTPDYARIDTLLRVPAYEAWRTRTSIRGRDIVAYLRRRFGRPEIPVSATVRTEAGHRRRHRAVGGSDRGLDSRPRGPSPAPTRL